MHEKITQEFLVKNGFTSDGCYCKLQLNNCSYLEYYKHEQRLRKYNISTLCPETPPFICFETNGLIYTDDLQKALELLHIDKQLEY